MTSSREIPDKKKTRRCAVDTVLMEIGGFLCFGGIFFFIVDLVAAGVAVVGAGAIVFLIGVFLRRSRQTKGR